MTAKELKGIRMMKRKRFLSLAMAAALVFVSASALPQEAFDEISTASVSAETSGDFEYKSLTGSTVEITKYKGKGGAVTIPSALGGKKVTSIDKGAFFQINSITSVTIPAGVNNIGASAFYKCESLASVTIPNSVTSIGGGAFYKCPKLKSASLPSGLKSLGNEVFRGCTSLESIVIPSGVKAIEYGTFKDCTRLSSVTIQNGVASIGNRAFDNCERLKSVTIPGSVKTVGESAFAYCKSLSALEIQNGVTSIGSSAFVDCNFNSVNIPSSVTTIAKKAFGYNIDGDRNKEHDYVKISGFAIYGTKGTAAEQYASKYGFVFTDSSVVTRLKGSGRYATAAAISSEGFESADTVVLTNGYKFADALAGVPYAQKLNAPILLTDKDSLPTETLAEIKRLKAKKVIILGGSGSVGQEVKDELDKNGLKYEIVKGSSRFATAVKIAEETQKLTKTDPTEIFFVSSDKFADALSVSSIAALKNAPIIYLPKTGAIDADTAEYLKTMKGKIKNAYVIGGSGVISNEVVKAAGKALGLNVDKTIVRVKGKTKYDTCVEVNTKFASVLNGTAICVATGEDFPDALAGGVFAAQKSAPLFLASGTLSDTQKSYLQTKNADSIFVFGGSKSVPDALVQSIAKASV